MYIWNNLTFRNPPTIHASKQLIRESCVPSETQGTGGPGGFCQGALAMKLIDSQWCCCASMDVLSWENGPQNQDGCDV